jgi:hypothetical protein
MAIRFLRHVIGVGLLVAGLLFGPGISWHSRAANGTFLFGPQRWSSDLRYILAHDEAL